MTVTTARARLADTVREMQLANDALDAANGTRDYNTALVALALVAREFLRRHDDLHAPRDPEAEALTRCIEQFCTQLGELVISGATRVTLKRDADVWWEIDEVEEA